MLLHSFAKSCVCVRTEASCYCDSLTKASCLLCSRIIVVNWMNHSVLIDQTAVIDSFFSVSQLY